MFNLFKNTFSFEKLMSLWFAPWGSWTPNLEVKKLESNISPEEQKNCLKMLEAMTKSCVGDFQESYNVSLDYSLQSLKKIDALISPDFRSKILAESNPKDFSNLFLVFICETTSYLGEIFRREVGFEWLPVAPYWESPLISKTNQVLFPFNWVIKRISSEEISTGSLYQKAKTVIDSLRNGEYERLGKDNKEKDKLTHIVQRYDSDEKDK